MLLASKTNSVLMSVNIATPGLQNNSLNQQSWKVTCNFRIPCNIEIITSSWLFSAISFIFLPKNIIAHQRQVDYFYEVGAKEIQILNLS